DVHRLRITAVLNDLQSHVHFAGENRGITDAHDGRRVEEDKIVTLFELADQVLHLGRTQDAERTAGQLSAGQKVEHRGFARLDDLFESVLLQKIIGQTHVIGHVQHLVKRGPAEVRIHDDDSLTVLGNNRVEIED